MIFWFTHWNSCEWKYESIWLPLFGTSNKKKNRRTSGFLSHLQDSALVTNGLPTASIRKYFVKTIFSQLNSFHSKVGTKRSIWPLILVFVILQKKATEINLTSLPDIRRHFLLQFIVQINYGGASMCLTDNINYGEAPSH